MGVLPKASWTWWIADAFAVPVLGDRYWAGAMVAYKQHMASGDPLIRAKALGAAYEEAREVFFARTSGFSPRAGRFGAHGGHEGDHLKMVIAPIVTTAVDYGQSRLTGTAGRAVRLGPVQLVGSK